MAKINECQKRTTQSFRDGYDRIFGEKEADRPRRGRTVFGDNSRGSARKTFGGKWVSKFAGVPELQVVEGNQRLVLLGVRDKAHYDKRGTLHVHGGKSSTRKIVNRILHDRGLHNNDEICGGPS